MATINSNNFRRARAYGSTQTHSLFDFTLEKMMSMSVDVKCLSSSFRSRDTFANFEPSMSGAADLSPNEQKDLNTASMVHASESKVTLSSTGPARAHLIYACHLGHSRGHALCTNSRSCRIVVNAGRLLFIIEPVFINTS